MKKFGIKAIESVKFINKDTGEEVKDIRDIQPEYKEYNKNTDIVELLINSTIPLEWMHNEFFNQFGHDESQPLYDKWVWECEKIENATKEDLWKAYGLISGYLWDFGDGNFSNAFEPSNTPLVGPPDITVDPDDDFKKSTETSP